ncbi:hypothetical protein [uncultured Brachyspira sp.]|uniref:hypothetical protein n=1 Tax=uncultured Brachyspira sp. TaxID=221953 RepID=UPI00321FF1E4
MYHQNYNIYGKTKEEIKFWTSKKLEDIKKDILDMIDYYGIDNIKSINVELDLFEKQIKDNEEKE